VTQHDLLSTHSQLVCLVCSDELEFKASTHAMVVSIPECQYQVANGVGVDEPRPSTPSVPVDEEAARFTVSGPLTHSLDDVRSWVRSVVALPVGEDTF
jgi:hypothetical protein